MTDLSRRTFLAASAALPLTSAAAGTNETINVGCIGTGGRCRTLMQSLAKIKNVRLVAVCDVWDKALGEAKKLADKKAFATRNYHDVLKRKDIQAVLIGSPDHWHAPMTVDAVKASKDVYVEKPLTHSLAEGKTVLDAVKASKCMVQVGTQQRSMAHIKKA